MQSRTNLNFLSEKFSVFIPLSNQNETNLNNVSVNCNMTPHFTLLLVPVSSNICHNSLRLSFLNTRLSVCSETLWQQNWSITFVSWWSSHIKFCTELAKTCRYHRKSLSCSLDWEMCPPPDSKNSKSQTHNPKFWHF